MQRSQVADQLCEKWEGYHDKLPNGDCTAYPDPGPTGLPITIGIGTTYYPSKTSASDKYGARPVNMGDVLTRKQAEECFKVVMDERERLVSERLKAPVTQAMYDALISFYYNLYPVSWPQQIDRCNAGKYEECASSFDKYVSAQGQRLQGLVNRRNDEEKLFRSQGLNPLPEGTGNGNSSGEEGSPSADFFPYKALPLPWVREDDYLTVGDKNADVFELRCALLGLGYLPKSILVSNAFDEELEKAVEAFQQFKSLNVDGVVGYITASAIELLMAEVKGNGSSKFITAKYYSQRDNLKEPCCTCGVTSAAMLLSAHGTTVTPDGLYNKFGKSAGQSPPGLAGIYEDYGYRTKWSYTGTFAEIRGAVDSGSPVVIHGEMTRAGHIVCVVGYDRNGLVVHDPEGAWNGVPMTSYAALPKNGKSRAYSYDRLRSVKVEDGDIWLSYIV